MGGEVASDGGLASPRPRRNLTIAVMHVADEAMPGTAIAKVMRAAAFESSQERATAARRAPSLRCQALPRIAIEVLVANEGAARFEEMPDPSRAPTGLLQIV